MSSLIDENIELKFSTRARINGNLFLLNIFPYQLILHIEQKSSTGTWINGPFFFIKHISQVFCGSKD